MRMTKRSVSGAVLKNIAYISMFVDHFSAVIVLNYIRLTAADGFRDPGIIGIYRAGRAVGRIAFILFAHQIVEGFVHTRSRGRFLLRLGLFALISEIPFDLAFSGEMIDWESQNVFFTLFLGVLVLTVWESLERYRGLVRWTGRVGVLIAGCGAAYLGDTDYRYMGVLLIFTFYIMYDRPLYEKIVPVGTVMLFGLWSANCLRYLGEGGYTAVSLFRSSLREMYGLAAFVPLAFYGGDRGRQLPKLFCYGFYPVHLLLLYGAARLLGLL